MVCGGIRATLATNSPDKKLLHEMAPNSPIDRAVEAALSPMLGFRATRLAALAWLALRLRPFRLVDLCATAFDRQLERRWPS